MPRRRTRFHGWGQFWIYDFDQPPDPDTWDQSSGLVVTADQGLVVLTSEFVGPITVTVDARDSCPAQADEPDGLGDGESWDDVVEASVVCTRGPLGVTPLYDEVADLPDLDTTGPGAYRVRVHARGRDVRGPDPEGCEPDLEGCGSAADEYLIVSWPEPTIRPLLAIRLTDRRGYATRSSVAREGRPVPFPGPAPDPQAMPTRPVFDPETRPVVVPTIIQGDGEAPRVVELRVVAPPTPDGG